MIKISNLSFSYIKNRPVLENVSFDIKEGECVILLGPNGVGKSTLISCLLGANKIKEGNISFDDINLEDLSYKVKSSYISYVPQLIEGNELTVKDTIVLGRLPYYKIYPSSSDYSLVDHYIDKFDLRKIEDSRTNEISGGERQKVNIARGLIQDSKVVIFDEPTSNLDIKSQINILNLIKEEKKESKKSFLISMHDINQALSIGDKFVFLKDGKIYKVCSKEEINEQIIEDVYGVKIQIINTEKGIHILYEEK